MTTREMIQAELEKLSEEDMDELLRVIRGLTQSEPRSAVSEKRSLLSKLKQIKIEAPEDFAANLDRTSQGPKANSAGE